MTWLVDGRHEQYESSMAADRCTIEVCDMEQRQSDSTSILFSVDAVGLVTGRHLIDSLIYTTQRFMI
jgi:hypothetical protein